MILPFSASSPPSPPPNLLPLAAAAPPRFPSLIPDMHRHHMELGGCCLTRYRAVSVLSSKADRIMSRYRPIAPKPVAFNLSGVSDSDLAASSAVSVDNSGSRQVPDLGKSNRRVRKRRPESITSPRSGKKAASAKSDKEWSSFSNSAAGSVLTERTLSGSLLTEKTLVDGGGRVASGLGEQGGTFSPVFVANGVTKGVGSMEATTRNVSCGESSEASVLGGATGRRKEGGGGIGSGMESTRIIEQDVGFMERAAASAPPSVLPERNRIASRSSNGCFTEMIRGITRLSTVGDVHSLMQSKSSAELPSCTQNGANAFIRDGFALAIPAYTADRIVDSGAPGEDDDGRGAKLVTLPLLPDTPSRGDSPADSSISTCSSLSTKTDLNSLGETVSARFSVFGDEPAAVAVANPGSSSNYFKGSLCDVAYIEHVYGNSSEPVVLVDDGRKVLWLNRAYERAYKDSIDRQVGKTPWLVPYIDPLGIPAQLGRFNVQTPSDGYSSATLWGFLRKFVLQEGDGMSSVVGFPLKDSISSKVDSFLGLGRGGGIPSAARETIHPRPALLDCDDGKKNGVIVPQPMRLVGSTVSLESVTELHLEAAPLSESLEMVKTQMEKGSSPAFITDSTNVVRWVNTAYKQMVGQPECPWLVSTVSSSKMDGSTTASSLASPRLTGEVLLNCSIEIPPSAPAFSGRVNIQWTNMGERSCMTVPCDVARLGSYGGKEMLVWKFDIEASLRLTCGA